MARATRGGTAEARRRHQSSGDRLVIGGPGSSVARLAFGALPEERKVARAVLSLHAHPSWTGARRAWRVVVHDSPALEALRAGRAPQKYRPPTRIVRLRPGIGRPLLVDVTPLVSDALDEERREVTLAVRAFDRNTPPLRFASPEIPEASRRPHLDLVVR